MAEMISITILDCQLDRMQECEHAVQQAVRELGLKAAVTQVSEPPYLARLNVWERLPALEIEGLIWSRESSQAFTTSEVRRLLQKHYVDAGGEGQPPAAGSE
jgi:hypothetical protein